METAWFEEMPDRYHQELGALGQLDIRYKEDEEMKAAGVLRLDLIIEGNNSNFDLPDKSFVYELTAVFPDSYPWFRPDVFAYKLELPRHQHLRGKNLCLLNRGSEEWDPTETLADLLKSQLGKVLRKGLIDDLNIVKEDPLEQAEPYSEYYNVILNAPILFDSSTVGKGELPGSIQKAGTIKVGIEERSAVPCRMAVLQTCLNDGQQFNVPEEVRRLFSHRQVDGMLYESPHHPPIKDKAVDVYNWLKSSLAQAGQKFSPPNSNVKLGNGTLNYVVGISFPEELKKGELGKGWIFLVSITTRIREDKKPKQQFYLTRAAYIGPAVSKDRVPRLIPLRRKTVSVCGVGAIGGFIAIELARSGVGTIRLLDFDIVDPSTTVRWPLGISAAGLEKTRMLSKFIKENYPSTHVEVIEHKIGMGRVDGLTKTPILLPPEKQRIDQLLSGSDMLIDAMAEEGVTNFLTRICVRKRLPYVVAYATPGAWGGVVMRWIPDETEGCWNCMKHWQNQSPELYVPPLDDQGLVQPPGCADITFTGASFDLQQVSTAAVRMAVSVLCSKEDGGYGRLDDDWAVLSLVNEEGKPSFPNWSSQKLLRHPQCGYCEKKYATRTA